MAREIQDKIKLFLQDQVPAFYQEEGPMFSVFLDAYYEYLEQSGQTLDYSRDLIPRVVDIDNTTDEFLEYFKSTFLNGFPGSFKANTELTVKNILDFYKAKGTPKAVELLFQILYADKASIAYPADDVIRLSNASFEKPKYIEVFAPVLSKLISIDNQEIVGGTSGAKAFVESIVTKVINRVKVHVVYLSNVRGEFLRDEVIALSIDGIQDEMPKVIGSLSEVIVDLGGKDFKIGDTFNVEAEAGTAGLVRTVEVDNATGLVDFKLANGGFGFSTNTEITTIDVNQNYVVTTNKVNEATTYANTTHPTAFDWHEKRIDSAEFFRWEYVDQTTEQVEFLSGSTLTEKIVAENLASNNTGTPVLLGKTSSATGNNLIAVGYVIGSTLNNANGTLSIATKTGTFGDQRQMDITYGGIGTSHPFELNEIINEENIVDLTYTSKAGTFSVNDIVAGDESGANGVVVSDSGSVLQVNGSFGTWTANDNVQFVSGTTAVTIVVTVANSGGNKYFFNGVLAPNYTFTAGKTYTFDQSDGSNSNHPLRLSATADGTHGGGSAYTTNVTTNGTPGSSGAYTRIAVTSSTTTPLYYYCSAHSGMGGSGVLTTVAADTANVVTISVANTGANGVITAKANLTNITLADITGIFNDNKKIHGARSHALASIANTPVNSGVADIYFSTNTSIGGIWGNTQAVVDGFANTSVEGQVIGSNTSAVGLRYVKFANGSSGSVKGNNAAPIVGRDSNTFANVSSVGTGTGAGFEIGTLENTESVTIYTDFIGGNNVANVAYLDCVVDGGNSGVGFLNSVNVTANGTGYTNGQIITFDLGGAGEGRPSVNATANVTTDNNGNVLFSTVITAGSGFYSNSVANLSNMSGGSGLAVTGIFDYGYGFPKDQNGDFTTILDNVLTRINGTIGTIASLAKINPGNNYNYDPFTAVYTQGIAGYNRRDIVVNILNKDGEFTIGENVQQSVTLQGQRLTTNGGNTIAFSTGESVKQLLATNSVSSTFAVGDIYGHGATQIDIENPRKRVQFTNGFFTVDVSNAIPFTASANVLTSTVTAQTATITGVSTVTQTATAKGQVYAQTEDELRLRRLSFSVGFNTIGGTGLVGSSSGATADIVTNDGVPSVYDDDATRPIGDNADITSKTLAANGIVKTLEVLNSGFGYNHGANLTLTSSGNSNIVVSGTANVHFTGTGEGRWRDEDGFLNNKYIHDNDYYQTHSYVIESGLSLDKYKDILLKIAHVGGTRLFGRVVSENTGNTQLALSTSTITLGNTAANGTFTEN